VKLVGSAAPGWPGSSVVAVAPLVPVPVPSYAIVPWFETVPVAPGLIVAVIVIVTEPPAGIAPFHVTVLVPTLATAVPLVAVAETSDRADGSTSVNSFPGLSG